MESVASEMISSSGVRTSLQQYFDEFLATDTSRNHERGLTDVIDRVRVGAGFKQDPAQPHASDGCYRVEGGCPVAPCRAYVCPVSYQIGN